MYSFKSSYVSQATYSIAQLGEWPTAGAHNNLIKCALHHMVHWYAAQYTRIARIASWNNADIQDLAQYYCFAKIRVKWKNALTSMPTWVAKHFWKLSNNYISNLIPKRYFSKFLQDYDVSDLQDLGKKTFDHGSQPVLTLFEGLVQKMVQRLCPIVQEWS